MVLKKDVTPAVKRKISKLNLGGIVYAELSNERLYSNGTLMGSLLGGVDADGKGVAGIEQMENKTLTAVTATRCTNRATAASKSPEP